MQNYMYRNSNILPEGHDYIHKNLKRGEINADNKIRDV